MRWLLVALGVITLGVGGYVGFDYFKPGTLVPAQTGERPGPGGKTLAERIREAEERSQGVKGVYMTATVANDRSRAATRLRESIVALLSETELDAVVIDVKETTGGLIITDELRKLIALLHQEGAWVIARQVVFKDDSQEKLHPDWYLRRKSGGGLELTALPIWRDNRGGSWLDVASPDVWEYQLMVAKAAADAGFDEIQFDYVRFPSDGDVRAIVYPVYDGKRPKSDVLREFFGFLHDGLKAYRPELILSADLFGYVAIHGSDLGIGQRLVDIGENFDYISLMVYPSHYYQGFEVPADPMHNIPALRYPYRSPATSTVAVSHPYEIVHRSLLAAADVLAGRTATATDQNSKSSRPEPGLGEIDKIATTSPSSPTLPSSPIRRARLRPWLQDFDLAVDLARGIRYDATKVRAQIDAAEAAGSSGWLLWSPDNVYTREALKPE